MSTPSARVWDTINIPRGQRVELWAKLALPGAGGRLALHTDGSPDAAINTTAVHLGRTTDGAQLSYATTLAQRVSDEFDSPFDARIDMVEGVIAGNIMSTLNTAILEILMPGAVKAVGAGYEELSFGGLTTMVKYSIAAIWAMPETAAKWAVFHLYSAINDKGVAMNIKRAGNDVGSTPVSFRGYSLADRAAGDQVGKIWKQVA